MPVATPTITVTLTVEPQAPNHGDTVTATYVVTGNDGIQPYDVTASGVVTVGATQYPVTASVTMPGTPPLPTTFETPTADGLTFEPTEDPAVFTAVVP